MERLVAEVSANLEAVEGDEDLQRLNTAAVTIQKVTQDGDTQLHTNQEEDGAEEDLQGKHTSSIKQEDIGK